MKKSDLIKKLQKEVDALGDDHILSYKIVDGGGGRSYFMLSPTRTISNGRKAKMNLKEFRDFVIDERSKQN